MAEEEYCLVVALISLLLGRSRSSGSFPRPPPPPPGRSSIHGRQLRVADRAHCIGARSRNAAVRRCACLAQTTRQLLTEDMFGVVVVYVRSPSSGTQRPKLDPGALVRTFWDGLALAKPVALKDARMLSLHVCGCQLSMSRLRRWKARKS